MPRAIRYWYSIVSETDLLLSDFCLVGVAPWYQTGRLRTVKYVHFISQFPAQLLEYTGFVVSVTYFASKNQFFERFSIFFKIYSLLQDQSFQTIFTKWQIVSVFKPKLILAVIMCTRKLLGEIQRKMEKSLLQLNEASKQIEP